jgi:hypothetical protein
MKLYHWRFCAASMHYTNVNYLVMSESVEGARAVLVEHIRSHSPMLPEQIIAQAKLIERNDPMFVAEPNYPLVLWEGIGG